jgi:hypothetical protein
MSETQESNGTQTGIDGETPQPQAGDPKQRTQEEREGFNRFRANVTPIERFLLFLSKTEMFALHFCTIATRMTQVSIGAMVLITGTLAFISSYFAVSTCFFKGVNSPAAIFAPALFALFYSTAIMTIDREIVSTTDKSFKNIGVWARIVFAVLIGLVISTPLELKLQEGRISAEIEKHVEARNKPRSDRIFELKKQRDKLMDELLAPYKIAYDNAYKDYQFRMDELKKEANIVMYGPIAKQRDADKDISNHKFN